MTNEMEFHATMLYYSTKLDLLANICNYIYYTYIVDMELVS